jgi:hypothetical protein
MQARMAACAGGMHTFLHERAHAVSAGASAARMHVRTRHLGLSQCPHKESSVVAEGSSGTLDATYRSQPADWGNPGAGAGQGAPRTR